MAARLSDPFVGTVTDVDQHTATSSPKPLTEATARHALGVACRQAGVDGSGAELLRIGSNAVFRLPGQVIARIAQDAGSDDNAQLQVAVARWLESENYPATRALHVEQPATGDGRPVTFWKSAGDGQRYAPIDQVAALIRQLHELSPPPFRLPAARPFDRGFAYLVDLAGLPDGDTEYLSSRLAELREQYDHLTFALPAGPIHGDANVGNVLLDDTDRPVLIDLDSFASGPREWDLVQTALFYERFGWHTDAEYRTFVDVYGFDIMTWDGYSVLADAREVMMTGWLARMASDNEQAASEVHKRIVSMQTGGDRRDWSPF